MLLPKYPAVIIFYCHFCQSGKVNAPPRVYQVINCAWM
jgi:hypothetical protein